MAKYTSTSWKMIDYCEKPPLHHCTTSVLLHCTSIKKGNVDCCLLLTKSAYGYIYHLSRFVSIFIQIIEISIDAKEAYSYRIMKSTTVLTCYMQICVCLLQDKGQTDKHSYRYWHTSHIQILSRKSYEQEREQTPLKGMW